MNNPPPLIASIVARDVPRNDVGARCVRFHSGIRGGETDVDADADAPPLVAVTFWGYAEADVLEE